MAVKKSKNVTPEQQKKAIVEEAWLKYYNQVLFEKGMITERERNLMINKIDARTTRSLSRYHTARGLDIPQTSCFSFWYCV